MPEEKKKRKSPERTGPIVPRDLREARDEVGELRTLVREDILNPNVIAERLDALYSKLDKMELRFKLSAVAPK